MSSARSSRPLSAHTPASTLFRSYDVTTPTTRQARDAAAPSVAMCISCGKYLAKEYSSFCSVCLYGANPRPSSTGKVRDVVQSGTIRETAPRKEFTFQSPQQNQSRANTSSDSVDSANLNPASDYDTLAVYIPEFHSSKRRPSAAMIYSLAYIFLGEVNDFTVRATMLFSAYDKAQASCLSAIDRISSTSRSKKSMAESILEEIDSVKDKARWSEQISEYFLGTEGIKDCIARLRRASNQRHLPFAFFELENNNTVIFYVEKVYVMNLFDVSSDLSRFRDHFKVAEGTPMWSIRSFRNTNAFVTWMKSSHQIQDTGIYNVEYTIALKPTNRSTLFFETIRDYKPYVPRPNTEPAAQDTKLGVKGKQPIDEKIGGIAVLNTNTTPHVESVGRLTPESIRRMTDSEKEQLMMRQQNEIEQLQKKLRELESKVR